MCSIVILRQPGATYPLILGGNRDEMAGRPWKPPARHWPDRPDLIGGIDELAGGSWLALNDTGVVAVVLNRWERWVRKTASEAGASWCWTRSITPMPPMRRGRWFTLTLPLTAVQPRGRG